MFCLVKMSQLHPVKSDSYETLDKRSAGGHFQNQMKDFDNSSQSVKIWHILPGKRKDLTLNTSEKW